MTISMIAAIPVKDVKIRPAPYFRGGKEYPCRQCGCEVWMGPKTKELADTGVPVFCDYCAVKQYQDMGGNPAEAEVHVLNPDLPLEDIP